jgi:hypothetical protein
MTRPSEGGEAQRKNLTGTNNRGLDASRTTAVAVAHAWVSQLVGLVG